MSGTKVFTSWSMALGGNLVNSSGVTSFLLYMDTYTYKIYAL